MEAYINNKFDILENSPRDESISSKILYNDYLEYLDKQNNKLIPRLNKSRFGLKLKSMGVKTKLINGYLFYYGIKLKDNYKDNILTTEDIIKDTPLPVIKETDKDEYKKYLLNKFVFKNEGNKKYYDTKNLIFASSFDYKRKYKSLLIELGATSRLYKNKLCFYNMHLKTGEDKLKDDLLSIYEA